MARWKGARGLGALGFRLRDLSQAPVQGGRVVSCPPGTENFREQIPGSCQGRSLSPAVHQSGLLGGVYLK